MNRRRPQRRGLVTMLVLLCLAGWVAVAHAQQGQHSMHKDRGMQKPEIQIPAALQSEHKEIHAALEAATKLTGKTGEAARALVKVLHPHFEREEQIALPPLGLLQRLANGEFDEQMNQVLPMTDSLRAELPRMLQEHKQIASATRRMATAAKQERQSKVAELAEQLMLHAQTEEQVMYPAAVLVGDVVRSRMAAAKSRAGS